MELVGDQRPLITELADPVEILRVMLAYRRQAERSFSVMKACKDLYRVSPALISLILKGRRKITIDRIDELSRLMALTAPEKTFFRNLVQRESGSVKGAGFAERSEKNRKEASVHILTDWLNVYVKDCFHIEEIQRQPELLYRQLAPLASNQRIKKSLDFLLKEGYLRRQLDGRIVIETNLTVTDPQVPSQKIRNFHKAALKIAQQAVDLYPPTERFANTVLIALTPERYQDLIRLIQDFTEKLKDFAEVASPASDRLYQIAVNVSPTGGKTV
jgi:uncharacterized protein (TIGR02147 family)